MGNRCGQCPLELRLIFSFDETRAIQFADHGNRNLDFQLRPRVQRLDDALGFGDAGRIQPGGAGFKVDKL